MQHELKEMHFLSLRKKQSQTLRDKIVDACFFRRIRNFEDMHHDIHKPRISPIYG